jgi:hypothetical protein
MTLTLASRTLQAPDGNLVQKQMANFVTNLKNAWYVTKLKKKSTVITPM